MKKVLLGLLSILLLLSLAACAADLPPTEAPPPSEPPAQPPPGTEPEEQPAADVLLEINIFHLGIRTPLDIKEEHVLALARQLQSLLANAANTDGMEAPPEPALNPLQVMNGYTALELVYSQELELPLKVGEEALTARRLLFAIPVSSSEGGLLYLGQDIYTETPLGRFFDQALQDAIYNDASDQVERAVFAADGQTVIIAGDECVYVGGEGEPELSGRLLNRMLYRAIAFYKNAYTSNVSGLQGMSTSTLYEAVLQASAGEETALGLGEEIIANLNTYVLSDFFLPQAIEAPSPQAAGYKVVFQLHERVRVEIDFVVEEDDLPLVSALRFIMTEVTAEDLPENI